MSFILQGGKMFKKLTIILCLFSSGCFFVGDQKQIPDPGQNQILSSPTDRLDSFQIKLLELHNQERTKRGMKKFVIDKNLCRYAQNHAELMVAKDILFHSRMKDLMRVNLNSNIVGENIAWGQETEESVVLNWMRSPLHRWNILGSSYNRVGFGMQKDKNNKNYWCAVFSD